MHTHFVCAKLFAIRNILPWFFRGLNTLYLTSSSWLNELILALGIKKTILAEKLNVSQAFVSQMCKGVSNPSDRTISDICRLFNVSELWLREGQGEMFLPIDENQQLEEVLVKMKMEKDNPFADMVAATLKAYYKLSEDNKKAVNEWVAGTISELTKKDTLDG